MATDHVHALRRSPLGDDAYQHIKRDILWCEYAPGQEVTESLLSERYHLGKAPVRSALLRLRQEGLVRPLARRGYQVAPITIRDVREIFQVRLVLEPPAARLAAGQADESHLRALEAEVQAAYVPGDRQSEAKFLEANRRFHVTLAAMTGNQRLASLVEKVLEETDRIFHLGLALKDRSDQFRHEHEDLVSAVVEGEGELAERLTYEAIANARDMVMEAILGSSRLLDVELTMAHQAG